MLTNIGHTILNSVYISKESVTWAEFHSETNATTT